MKEEDIRPQAIFDEYIRLATIDANAFFSGGRREDIPCPACGEVGEHAFTKNDFSYAECPNCLSLYVSPRPSADAFNRYYTESPSSKYWATTFYRQTADARRERLWKPKARLVQSILEKYQIENPAVYDIGGGYGIFSQEIRDLGFRPVVIEPAPHLAAICRQSGLPTIEAFLEDLTPQRLEAGPKVFVSFELFEHLHDPQVFLSKIADLLSPGELLIFTTLSGMGVDIRALWEHSKSVTPPYHLNFLNPTSMEMLLRRSGLESLEITTPGRLDISILENNRSLIKDRFWRSLIDTASESTKAAWQKSIAELGFSSHMMVTCRRPI